MSVRLRPATEVDLTGLRLAGYRWSKGLNTVNIADLVTARPPEHRNVGIRYENRLHLVTDAKKIYLELGVPCDLHDLSITYAVPRHAAPWYAGAFERLTGHPAFNEWEEPSPARH